MPEIRIVETMEHRRRRALWRATHRGTKELDWLIGRFAEARLPAMADDEMTLFEKFLTVPDPELHAWILEPAQLDVSAFRDLVQDLRQFHGMNS